MDTRFQAPGDYPLPQNLSRNIRYARALLVLYSGRDSELTAVTQYRYHYILTQQLPSLAECLAGISLVEMRHLNILGNVIYQLGLRPSYTYFQGTRRVRWNAGFVREGRNPRDMLEEDIRAEACAVEGYRNAIRWIPEESIALLLQRLLLDEELHLALLRGLRERL
jgi:bacterioferritin